jgi:hypothetical protein
MDSFFVEYAGNDGRAIFEALGSLIQGSSVDLSRDLSSGLLQISCALGNDELLEFLLDGDDSITLSNICRLLTFHSLLGICDESEIEFAASHFSEIEEQSLRDLPASILESVLSSESLRLKDEDSLLKFIHTVDCDHQVLYRYLRPEYLTCEGIRALVDNLEFESLDRLVWSSLCRRLLLEVFQLPIDVRFAIPESPSRGHDLPFTDGFPFKGIISFLTAQCGGNVHVNRLVSVSSSSHQHGAPWQVADHGWGGHWASENVRNSWISFDFRNYRVALSHYTLKSHPGMLNFFREWVIEGSNDGASWLELDNRSTQDLCGASMVRTYPCVSPASTPFRHIRMRQTGLTTAGHYHLILTNIEFFGQLTEVQPEPQ